VIQNISEKDFAYNVEDALNKLGWRWFHPRPARVRRHGRDIYETAYAGHKGFLDYLALRPPRILVFELKTAKMKMTPEQEEWFDAWESCQRAVTTEPIDLTKHQTHRVINGLKFYVMPEVYLWRPKDFEEILEILK